MRVERGLPCLRLDFPFCGFKRCCRVVRENLSVSEGLDIL